MQRRDGCRPGRVGDRDEPLVGELEPDGIGGDLFCGLAAETGAQGPPAQRAVEVPAPGEVVDGACHPPVHATIKI